MGYNVNWRVFAGEDAAMFDILKYPDPLLRQKAGEVKEVDDSVRRLMDEMLDTLRLAPGIGLAAAQVGSSRRVIVLDVPLGDEEGDGRRAVFKLANPEVISSGGEMHYEEGCLSLPGIAAEVKRAAGVKVKALDEEGEPAVIEAEGLLAVALQHEIDHLDGVLFIDRLSSLKREFVLRKYKKALAAAAGS